MTLAYRAWKTTLLLGHFLWAVSVGAGIPVSAAGLPGSEPPAASTFYVSKLGDNSDGSSWRRAFHTVQSALSAIPDGRGGYRVVVRPDTYMEANLFPQHRGAAGNYNELVGDWDGAMGSGTTGWVILDSGDPEKGFKSYDWWGPIRAYKRGWSAAHTAETFSAIGWDRWALKRLYVTGGDGGLFFDLVDKAEPFSVRVEDCMSVGRAFGGGVANVLSRPEEPSRFVRCRLWCLDWWGDAAGAYVRAEHPQPPASPDVVFEDCTLVGPDNALQAGNPGYEGYTRVSLNRCRLVSLNFSQPQGKPGTGVIFSTIDGKLLHVDLEDCTLIGCKILGAGKGDISYSVKGDVKAYVQFQQEVPAGMLRLGYWPVELFQSILPVAPPPSTLLKPEPGSMGDLCEVAPVAWHKKLLLLKCNRPATAGSGRDHFLTLEEVDSGETRARFAEGYSLASAIVNQGKIHIFASRLENGTWNDVTRFSSSDLSHWTSELALAQENEHLFNSSVCRGARGFVMAYESDDPKYTPFTIKFATSSDLATWTKLPGAIFGPDRYAACPCIRYVNGYYYLLYLEHRTPRWFFETYVARSSDLKNWDVSAASPVLSPGLIDGINASDPDLVEFAGKTYLYYSVGDQRTWSRLRRVVYPGSMRSLFEKYFRR